MCVVPKDHVEITICVDGEATGPNRSTWQIGRTCERFEGEGVNLFDMTRGVATHVVTQEKEFTGIPPDHHGRGDIQAVDHLVAFIWAGHEPSVAFNSLLTSRTTIFSGPRAVPVAKCTSHEGESRP